MSETRPAAERFTFPTLEQELLELRRLRTENAALSQRVRELEEATNGIADYGWAFDGRITFTVNCTTEADARRLQELLQQRLP